MKFASTLLLVLLLAACSGPHSSSATPRDTVAAPGLPVANSVQQAYHPGALRVPSVPAQGYSGPMLALQATRVGAHAAEPTIAVASDGTAYFAGSELVVDTDFVWGVTRTNILRSTDGGLTWSSIQPVLPVGNVATPPGNADPLIYLDPATDRVFTFDLVSACNWASYSDDRGETWTTNPVACGNVPVDHQTLVAVPPIGALDTLGYPSILIWCSNRVIDEACGRSLDGGLTWTPGGTPFLPTGPTGTACSSLAGHLAADPEGWLYMPSAHCGPPEVAISSDGGLTFTQVNVSDIASEVAHTAVTTDLAGNVYYVWIDATQKPFLSYSRDHGRTWSAPMMIAPPDVKLANFPVVAARTPGHVAVSFPSSTWPDTRKPPAWDQTVTITEDVFAAQPLWLSATANDPAFPIHRGACHGRCGGLWDFLDITISSSGEAWASASFDCSGECLEKGVEVADKIGEGVAIRQIGGPRL